MRPNRIALLILSLALCNACSETEAKTFAPQPPAQSASSSSAALVPPCPEEMTLVDDFCIDRWEAHLVVAGDPVSPHPGNHRPRHDARYLARSAPGVKPQGYVTRFEAAEACALAGKRLCRAREWFAACRGPRATQYPYGDERVEGRCNTHKPHLLVKLFGRKTPLTPDAHYNNPRLHDEAGFLARTGQYEDCRNDYGVYDMVGNLHEWVADDVSNALPKSIPLAYGNHLMGPRGNGVFMGGYFSSRGEHGKGCIYATTSHAPEYHDYSIGFRCCRALASRP